MRRETGYWVGFAGLVFFLFCSDVLWSETVHYQYDEVERLVRAEYPGGIVVQYVYDSVGNRLTKSVVDVDEDDDGLPDAIEEVTCTEISDADTDDDGIPDGVEDTNHNGVVDPGETDPCNPDSDGDGIQDGTELGYTLNDVGPDTDLGIFQPDLDPGTTTDPLNSDTDGDGLKDGKEDLNHNGRVDPGESDPNHCDLRPMPWLILLLLDDVEELDCDGDGIADAIETMGCTDPLDGDTDDDGIVDGVEDADHDGLVGPGETDPCNADTDGDGIQDGTEMGYTLNDVGSDTDLGIFQPDLDPTTTTDPLSADSDGDGIDDGDEDLNHNGRVDEGETGP